MTNEELFDSINNGKDELAKLVKQSKPRVLSGFLKPVTVSTELCDFVGCEQGSLLSRVDVTRAMCAYVKDNNLQSDPKSKSVIVPDEKLAKLLNTNDNTSFKDIQKLLKVHFIKN